MKGTVAIAATALGALAVAACGSSGAEAAAQAAAAPPPRPAPPRSASRGRSPGRSPARAGAAALRPARGRQDNAANKTKITIVQGDTQLNPAQATTVTQQFTSNSKIVAVVGPAGSQEVEAVGPLMARAGLPFITGSATAADLTTGKYPTFFRVVSKDSVQGPQDANYIVNNLHPKALMIVDDQEVVLDRPGGGDDAGVQGGRDQGRPRVGQPEAHRLLLAGGQGHARHVRRGAALAGRRQRPAVRPEPRRAAQEGGHLRHRRPVLARHVHDQRLVRVLVRPGHHRRSPADARDRRGGEGEVRERSARSARRSSRRRT